VIERVAMCRLPLLREDRMQRGGAGARQARSLADFCMPRCWFGVDEETSNSSGRLEHGVPARKSSAARSPYATRCAMVSNLSPG